MAFIDNALTSSGGTMTRDEERRRLIDLRWRRMSEIKRVRDGGPGIGTEGHRILQAEIAAYNEAVNSLRDYDYRLGMDPMDKLPEELWIKILKYCMRIKDAWDTPPSVESILVLTLVSKRWRAFILSEPSFWNKVVLTNHHDDASMTVLVSLSLSRNLPLTLYIDLPFRGWAEVRSEMLEHHNRIENIVMSGMYSFEMHAKKRRYVKRLLGYLHPLPSLKRLGDAYETSETEYDAVWILKRFSKVSHLPNLALTKDALLLAKRLQAVHTYERIDDIFPMLEVLPNLKKVVFWDDSNVNMANGRSPTRESPPSPNPLHWSSFAYHCIRPKLSISVLERLIFLTSLEFVGGFGLLTDAIAILHSFKKLRRFATHLSLDDKEEKSPPNLIFPCPTVRSFVITVHHRNQPTPNPTNDGVPLVRKYRVLRDMLTESMPYIEYFYLSSNEAGYALPLFDSRAFSSLVKVHFHGVEGVLPSSSTSVQLPPSAKSLLVSCGTDIFRTFSSVTIESLAWRDRRRDESTEKMDPLAWPEIRHLEVHGACVHWNGVGFSSLRVLELSIWTEGTVDNSVTSFFRDVASQPESYPSLEKIILPELPEWDTLVIMLERRNLLTGPYVNQISDIQFPFPIPAQLSCLVHDLLAGKWPTRPSHFELSLAGNVDIIMDLSLPGCYMCHRALRLCDAPVKENWTSNFSDVEEEQQRRRMREYPKTENQILATWAERIKLWEDLNHDRGGRLFRCEFQREHMYTRRANVDSYEDEDDVEMN